MPLSAPIPLTFLWFILMLGSNAHASVPHETFYYEGTPSPELVNQWSQLEGQRSFTIDAGDPGADELKPLAALRGADRIQVEMQSYPSEDPVWKDLAAQGIEFVALGQPGVPTDDEVRRLNEAGFSRCLLVLQSYPTPDEAARISKLTCRVSLTFATSAYPQYEDKPGLIALPASIPLFFATDYWPFYTHMDLFNQLPNTKRLRVSDMLPPDDSLPYLRNIHLLEDVQVSLEYDPQPSDWSKFDGLPLTWSSRNHVPSADALTAFEHSGAASHRLIIDSDQPWSAEEQARIAKSALNVEWIHQAPQSWSPIR